MADTAIIVLFLSLILINSGTLLVWQSIIFDAHSFVSTWYNISGSAVPPNHTVVSKTTVPNDSGSCGQVTNVIVHGGGDVATGERGPQGVKGERGERGPAGPRGEKGMAGNYILYV